MDAANQGTLFFMPGGHLRVPVSSEPNPPPPHSHLLVGHQTVGAGTGFVAVRGQFAATTDPSKHPSSRPSAPPVQLYLCDSTAVGGRETGEKVREKVSSMELLQQCYQSLNNKKIKDNLSSFLPDIPGEFDSNDTTDSMLRTLIDRPPIGGREFLPLSEQSLLGFRLHPGALPEQYRLDPFSGDTQHHHKKKKKKKHKHKHVDREDSSTLDNYSPSSAHPHSPPIDPCSFIKAEQTTNFFPSRVEHHPPPPPPPPPSHPHPHHLPGSIHPSQVFPPTHLVAGRPGILTSTPASVIVGHGGGPLILSPMMQLAGTSAQSILEQQQVKKRNKKRHQDNGEGGKKKKKKDGHKEKKRKKKEHHGGLDAIPHPVIGVPPPLISSAPSSYIPTPSLATQPPPRPPQHM